MSSLSPSCRSEDRARSLGVILMRRWICRERKSNDGYNLNSRRLRGTTHYGKFNSPNTCVSAIGALRNSLNPLSHTAAVLSFDTVQPSAGE